jgi:hypothetical protein
LGGASRRRVALTGQKQGLGEAVQFAYGLLAYSRSLGLAIVRATARACGGVVTWMTCLPGCGVARLLLALGQ